LATLDAGLDAIAVELHLVQPALARGWRLGEAGELRRNELRHRSGLAVRRRFGSRLLGPSGGFRRGRLALPLPAPHGIADLGSNRAAAGKARPDLVQGAAGLDRGFLADEGVRVVARRFVPLLDQQPVVALLAVPRAHADQGPAAVQALALEMELEFAGLQRLLNVGAFLGYPFPAIEELHDARAIAARDHAFEFAIVQRMILDLDRQALVLRRGRGPLGHGPRLVNTVVLQPEIVVQPRRVVPLHHETKAALAFRADAPARLGRRAEVALLLIGLQRRHGGPSVGGKRRASGPGSR